MKHKKFDSVLPYGYFLVRKSDSKKYVGIRYANVKKNLTPTEDFGKVYFTSGRLKKEFKKNPDNFWFKLCYTFDSIDELFEWERKIALRIYKRPDWANQGWGQNYGENPEIGSLISEGRRSIGRDGKTSVERGAEKLKDWVWNTDEGAEHREEISVRISKMRAEYTDEREAEIQAKRKLKMDFKAASIKAQETMKIVGEDGLTGLERKSEKGHATKLANGVYEKQGKTFSDWAMNTEEGLAYREQQSIRASKWRAEMSPVEKENLSNKLKQTLANRSPDQIKEHVDKIKSARLTEDDSGLNGYERSAIKSEKTKAERGTHEIVSKKRGELFNKKLSEMSEEEFEEYCVNYIPRLAKSFRTRRNKYLQQVKVE